MEENVVYLIIEVNTCFSGPWNTRVLAAFNNMQDADNFVEILAKSRMADTGYYVGGFFVEEWRVR